MNEKKMKQKKDSHSVTSTTHKTKNQTTHTKLTQNPTQHVGVLGKKGTKEHATPKWCGRRAAGLLAAASGLFLFLWK